MRTQTVGLLLPSQSVCPKRHREIHLGRDADVRDQALQAHVATAEFSPHHKYSQRCFDRGTGSAGCPQTTDDAVTDAGRRAACQDEIGLRVRVNSTQSRLKSTTFAEAWRLLTCRMIASVQVEIDGETLLGAAQSDTAGGAVYESVPVSGAWLVRVRIHSGCVRQPDARRSSPPRDRTEVVATNEEEDVYR